MRARHLRRLIWCVVPTLVSLPGVLSGSSAAEPRPKADAGQGPQPGAYSAEKFDVTAERGHRVRMRDGIRLSVDVYRPAGKDRYPGILIHTPYNNNAAGLVQRAKWFARRGYAVALSDVRGRYDS